MSIQYIITIGMTLVGDGATTTFVIPTNVFQEIGRNNQTAVNPNLIPVSAVVRNSPVGVTSAVLDGSGNLTITFTSALPSGSCSISIDLTYNGGTTQPAPLSVRESKDVGRTGITFFYDDGAVTTLEGLISFTTTKGTSTVAAATSYTVTAGKTLRITSVTVVMRSTSGSQIGRIRIRTAASGITATSPIVWGCELSGSSGNSIPFAQHFPDGYEISGGNQVAISQIFGATTPVLSVFVTGFEY